MYHQSRAKFDRAAQVGCRGCVVDDQRNACRIRHVGNGTYVHDVAARIGNGFAKDRTGIVVNRCFHGINVVKVDKLARPTETFDRLAELRHRAPI